MALIYNSTIPFLQGSVQAGVHKSRVQTYVYSEHDVTLLQITNMFNHNFIATKVCRGLSVPLFTGSFAITVTKLS